MKKEEDQGMRKEMKKKLGNVFRKAGAGVLLAMFLTVTAYQPVSAAVKYVPTGDGVQLTKDIVQVATNGKFSAAVMQNGDLFTWGTQAVVTDEAAGHGRQRNPIIKIRQSLRITYAKYFLGNMQMVTLTAKMTSICGV